MRRYEVDCLDDSEYQFDAHYWRVYGAQMLEFYDDEDDTVAAFPLEQVRCFRRVWE